MNTEQEKMLAGLPYDAGDKTLQALQLKGKHLIREYNTLDVRDHVAQQRLLREVLGEVGEHVLIATPFHVDYGAFIRLGNGVEINMNCVFLDCNYITIGDFTLIGPNVQLYAVGHPVAAQDRFNADSTSPFPYALGTSAPITIGRSCWIGGSVVVLPGITIGDNVTIAAGSVVTKNIPSNSLAMGSPARVVRTLPSL